MPYEPSWIKPPNFLGYMVGGSEAGLGAARILQADRELAARTGLGYAQLDRSHSYDMARIAAAQQAHLDSLAQRQAEQAAQAAESLRNYHGLESYRGTETQHRTEQEAAERAAQALRERHQDFLENKPVKDQLYHVGDTLVKIGPDGTAQELFKAPAKQTKDVTVELPAVEGQPAVPGSPAYHRELFGLEIPGTHVGAVAPTPEILAQPKRSFRRVPTPEEAAMALPQATQPGLPPQPIISEVRRVTKDGRTAIFDANTKQFLRYAD